MPSRNWSIGPLSIAAGVLILLGAIGLPIYSRSPLMDAIAVGLSFGLAGAAALWVCQARAFSWWRVASCYGVAIVMSQYFLVCDGRVRDFQLAATFALVWSAFATLTLVACLSVRWIRAQLQTSSDGGHGEQPPRFTVRHLLISMAVLAVVSLIVRYALPEFSSIDLGTVTVWTLQSTALVVVCVELLRRPLPIFAQLGGLAVAGIVGTLFVAFIDDWEDVTYANAMQIAILAVAMVVPQLDRYRLRIHVEPREPRDDQTPLAD